MTAIDYTEAKKLAVKEYRKAVSAGESPYPPHLDGIVPGARLAAASGSGREQVPLALVIGTKQKGRINAFARNFMPLLDPSTEFAAKWITLCGDHLQEGIREPVRLYEYRNRFYVEEGNKRVSVLKYFGADSIEAEVIRVTDPDDGSDLSEEAEAYAAFLRFYESSRLRTVEFSEADSYDRLQSLLGRDPGKAWTEEERKTFELFYSDFYNAYTRCGGKGQLPEVCDAMLSFLELNEYGRMTGCSPEEIRRLVRSSMYRIRTIRGGIGHGRKARALRVVRGKAGVRKKAAKTFRILAVADDESRYYYEDYEPGRLEGLDLILACGDLSRVYLEFLTTMAPCPVLYIRGNHDDPLEEDPPGGCICVEDRVYVYQGLRIAGLGGSYRYREGGNMYTEEQMRRRALRLAPAILRRGGIDILMTHAPARGINDFDSLTHRGFETFRRLLERYRPGYLVHGHIHKNYGIHIPQRTQWNGTTVINAYDHCVFEVVI